MRQVGSWLVLLTIVMEENLSKDLQEVKVRRLFRHSLLTLFLFLF